MKAGKMLISINMILAGLIVLSFVIFDIGTADAASHFENAYPNEKNICVLNHKMKPWYKDYVPQTTAAYYKKGEYGHSRKITFSWKASRKVKKPFTLYLSLRKDMKNSRKYKTNKCKVKVSNLYTGKDYYWRVKGYKGGKKVASVIYHFKTQATPRTINASKVRNIRDIGGYVTESGKMVKQGKVFRSGNMDKIKKSGRKTLLKQLKIKTDLDLRKKGEGLGGKRSPLGKKVKYIHISGVKYYEIWKSAKNKKRLVKEMKVFVSKRNYPIVFHCIYGRDRTGTLAFMLNSLLGCKVDDLHKDYEMTFFSKLGNSSKSEPNRSAVQRSQRYYRLYNYMRKYKDPELPLSQNVAAFLLDNGMTKKEIASIKRNLLQ